MHFLSRHLARIPQPCVLCAAPAQSDGLCTACRADLPRLPVLHCPLCALPTSTSDICGRCLKRTPHFDAVHAAFVYAFPIDRLIQQLKFNSTLAVSKLMGRELVLAARHDLRPDLVIPLPLSKERLRERGFNQSAEIAREVARDFDLDLDHDACVRARHTIPQVGLTLDRRRANMRNAFQCRRSLVGAKVAVVDDVMTTGATLDEVARTLKESGAARVTGWVVARTPESRR